MEVTMTSEIRPGLTMTHRSKEGCLACRRDGLWIEWAERHGFRWQVVSRSYYNLPARGVPEVYWELHIQVDDAAYRPNRRYMHGQMSLDEAISMSRLEERGRREAAESARAELAARRAEILARYGKIKVYPRDDVSYRWQCLWTSIRDVLPWQSPVIALLSGSGMSRDEAMAIVLD